MDHVRLPKRKRSTLSAEQKAAFVIVMFLGLGGVILGFKSFGANLSRPFDLQLASAVANSNGEFMLSSEREAAEIEAQKTRDTDEDGLNDYDELYIFKTSPYLVDSDSDGFTDDQEVFSGNDPNCPKGKTCRGVVAAQEGAGETSVNPDDLLRGPLPENPLTKSSLGSLDGIEFTSEQQVIDFFGSMTIQQIREALTTAGVPQETLDALDDEALRATFEESVQSAAAGGSFQELLNQSADQVAP